MSNGLRLFRRVSLQKQVCARCEVRKFVVEFPRRGKKGRSQWCAPCNAEISSVSGRATRKKVPDRRFKPYEPFASTPTQVPCWPAFPPGHPARFKPL